jgi:crotonobetainyl-CoA:carnitine CoA-transferase CaiB-like acyl-CoA transferase/putative sterol carrier protein
MTALEIVLSLPQRFKPEKWNGKTWKVQLDFSEPQGLQYLVTVSGSGCKLEQGLFPNPDCLVRCTGENYAKMELGELNPQWALMSGKVKVSHVALMLEFTKQFRRIKPGQGVESPTLSRPTLSGPLEGIRVLDLSRLLPGPLASLWLAELGAEVIKIEDPDSPDPIREFVPIQNGVSVFHTALNRHKKSLALNLRMESGKKAFLKLVEKADIVLEGFRPGVMAKIGLDAETCRKVNPGLIFVSISGYGQTGPMAHLAGHDLNYLAMSGLLSLIGEGNMPSFQTADVAGGSYAALSSILAALVQKQRKRIGAYLDISMTEGVMPLGLLAEEHAKALPGATFELSGSMPNYRLYATKDQRFMALAALEPKFWELFCKHAGKEHLLNMYVFSKADLQKTIEELEGFFSRKTMQEWVDWNQGQDFCLTPVLNQQEVKNHVHFKTRSSFDEAGYQRNPFGFTKTENQGWAAPKLGEDSEQIFSDFGFSEDEIRKLQEK